MIRLRTTVWLALLVAVAIPPLALSASAVDRGRRGDNPPRAYRYGRVHQVWLTEWNACGESFRDATRDPDVHVSWRTVKGWLAVSPQYAARRLAIYVEMQDPDLAMWTGYLLPPAIDGCRNGLLWSYYHGG